MLRPGAYLDFWVPWWEKTMGSRWKFLDVKTDERQSDMERLLRLQRSRAEWEPFLEKSHCKCHVPDWAAQLQITAVLFEGMVF